MSPKSTPPLDYDRFLKTMCNGREDFALQIIKLLIEERAPQLLADATDAFETEDLQKIRNICHSIHGTLSNICAVQLAEKALEIRLLAADGKLLDLPKSLSDLKTDFDELMAWGKDYIAGQ